MALPIDLGKIKTAANEISQYLDVEICINVYIDYTANKELINSIKDYLSLSADTVVINYLDIKEKKLYLEYEPNFAIIIAGNDELCAKLYCSLVKHKIASFIITNIPQTVISYASYNNIAILSRDIICPSIKTYTWIKKDKEKVIDFSEYNIVMDLSIKRKMVEWIYNFAFDCRISYAAMFPFMREKIADNIINSYCIENVGFGVISILPGSDMPLMTMNQARMLLELAAIYGYDIDENRIPEIIVLILSAFLMRYLSKTIQKKAGFGKFIVRGLFGYGGTKILGIIAKNYFESGQAIENLADKIKNKTLKKLPSVLHKS